MHRHRRVFKCRCFIHSYLLNCFVYDDMAKKKINISKGKLFCILLTTGIVLLLVPQRITNGLNFLFSSVLNPVLRIGPGMPRVFRPGSSSEGTVSASQYDDLWKDYKNLHADYMTLHKRYEKLAQIRSGLPKPGPEEGLVYAEVMRPSITTFSHELLINRGGSDGVRSGQYIIGSDRSSVVGIVSETAESTARVKLLTDANQRIEVCIWREGQKDFIVKGQMHGDGGQSAKIPLISAKYKLRVGDTVYAAAKPGFLETSRVIGEITELKRDTDPLLWDITVNPIEKAENLTEIWVIVIKLPK